MSRKLVLVREEKLFRLLPGKTESSRLEASGVAVVDDHTAFVIFDKLNEKMHSVVPGSGALYRFPNKSYGNIEGIACLTPDTLVAVSDRAKSDQPARCAEKDQSIHVFRMPGE